MGKCGFHRIGRGGDSSAGEEAAKSFQCAGNTLLGSGFRDAQMKADIIVCFGGTEAEKFLLGDASMGLESDLDRATSLARAIVESMGVGGPETGVGPISAAPFGSAAPFKRLALCAWIASFMQAWPLPLVCAASADSTGRFAPVSLRIALRIFRLPHSRRTFGIMRGLKRMLTVRKHS